MAPRRLRFQPPIASSPSCSPNRHRPNNPKTIFHRNANRVINFLLKMNRQSCARDYAFDQFATTLACRRQLSDNRFALYAKPLKNFHFFAIKNYQNVVENFCRANAENEKVNNMKIHASHARLKNDRDLTLQFFHDNFLEQNAKFDAEKFRQNASGRETRNIILRWKIASILVIF